MIKDYEGNILKQAFYSKKVFYDIKSYLLKEMFQDEVKGLIWDVYKIIEEQNIDISYSSVTDVLERSGNEQYITVFDEIINAAYIDEDQWKYHVSTLVSQYNDTRVIQIASEMKSMAGNYDANDIYQVATQKLDQLAIQSSSIKSMKASFSNAYDDIVNKASGKVQPYLPTGDEKFDKIVATSPGTISLVASVKGAGKTKFSIHWALGLLNNNDDVAIQWHSYEVSELGLIRNIIARDVSLTEREIQSRNHDLTEEELEQIEESKRKYENYDIEFHTQPMNILEINSAFKRFCALRPDKKNILIIDNIGLITNLDRNKNQTDNDDTVAKELVKLRDATNSVIIPIHHVRKEAENPNRMKEGYRLKDSQIRGSTRIADFANQILLINRPSLFPDLTNAEKLRVKPDKFEKFKKLVIVDVTKNRESELGLIRYFENLAYCQFKEWL